MVGALPGYCSLHLKFNAACCAVDVVARLKTATIEGSATTFVNLKHGEGVDRSVTWPVFCALPDECLQMEISICIEVTVRHLLMRTATAECISDSETTDCSA